MEMFNTINISIQATTYLVLIIITTLINLICYYILAGTWGFVAYLIYTLITIPLVILWMYNIDCLTTGNCYIWSWVITWITLISVLTTTIMLVAISVNPSLSNSIAVSTISSTSADTTASAATADTKKEADKPATAATAASADTKKEADKPATAATAATAAK